MALLAFLLVRRRSNRTKRGNKEDDHSGDSKEGTSPALTRSSDNSGSDKLDTTKDSFEEL
jgi:hypothetical protein